MKGTVSRDPAVRQILPMDYRRRINTEERAKVITGIWGPECIQFFAAPRRYFALGRIEE